MDETRAPDGFLWICEECGEEQTDLDDFADAMCMVHAQLAPDDFR
jgi:hypothetical protein